MGKKMLIRDAAEALCLTQNALRNGIRTGQIPYFKVGNRYVLDVELVEKILEQTAINNMLTKKNNELKNGIRRVCI